MSAPRMLIMLQLMALTFCRLPTAISMDPVTIDFPATESALRAAGISDRIVSNAVDLSASDVHQELLARFSNASKQFQPISRFVAQIRELKPVCFVAADATLFVCYRENIAKKGSGQVWEIFIPFVLTGSKELSKVPNSRVDLLFSPMRGIRESMEFGRGFLLIPETASQWAADFNFGQHPNEGWHVVFHASNGDMLLCDDKSNAGWLVLETGKFQPLSAEKIGSFIENFIPLLKKGRGVNYWSARTN